MFNLFKERTTDIKSIRNKILQFIKDKLQKAEGGEGANITGIYLFFTCVESDRYLYESAVYSSAAGKFREEIQRIADDYAIQLPSSWKFEFAFSDKYPSQSYVSMEIPVSLFLSTGKAGITGNKRSHAFIKVLNGHAEKDTYIIYSSNEKVNIGREAKAQVHAGFVRQNTIAFTSSESMEMNRSISRQHAHIEWEAETASFLVFADAGGIPPHNKMKIRTVQGLFFKMQATEVGHRLNEGDQIILGDSAVLEFTYTGKEQ